MREVEFANNEFYHLFNRGVDKRKIFVDQEDFQKFYENLYLFNDVEYKNPLGKTITNVVELSGADFLSIERKQHVRIVSYCLIANHFHLFVEQLEEHGISKFMHKIQMTFSKYFNKKYKRTGSLFESPFKAVHVKKSSHFVHLPRYIHLNALDYDFPEWRDGILKDWDKAELVIDNYPWSSHGLFVARQQQLPTVDEDFVSSLFADPDEYIDYLRSWSGRKNLPEEWSPGDLSGSLERR